MWIKRDVVMLPTNQKASIIGLYKDTGKLVFNNPNNKDIPRGIPQHLYILSDEKIKDGDWVIDLVNKYITRSNENKNDLVFWNLNRQRFKKIIVTTDTSITIKSKVKCHECKGSGLENDMLHNVFEVDPEICTYCKGTKLEEYTKEFPQPSQAFIQKFIEEYNKGNIITKVMVEYEKIVLSTTCEDDYDELRLKVNPKDNTITIKKIKNNFSLEEMFKLMDEYQDYLFKTNEPVKTFKEWYSL